MYETPGFLERPGYRQSHNRDNEHDGTEERQPDIIEKAQHNLFKSIKGMRRVSSPELEPAHRHETTLFEAVIFQFCKSTKILRKNSNRREENNAGANRSDVFAAGMRHPAGIPSEILLRLASRRKPAALPAGAVSRPNSGRPKQAGANRRSILHQQDLEPQSYNSQNSR